MYFVAISNPNETITINNTTEIINLENRFKNCTICSNISSDINFLLPLLLFIELLPLFFFLHNIRTLYTLSFITHYFTEKDNYNHICLILSYFIHPVHLLV